MPEIARSVPWRQNPRTVVETLSLVSQPAKDGVRNTFSQKTSIVRFCFYESFTLVASCSRWRRFSSSLFSCSSCSSSSLLDSSSANVSSNTFAGTNHHPHKQVERQEGEVRSLSCTALLSAIDATGQHSKAYCCQSRSAVIALRVVVARGDILDCFSVWAFPEAALCVGSLLYCPTKRDIWYLENIALAQHNPFRLASSKNRTKNKTSSSGKNYTYKTMRCRGGLSAGVTHHMRTSLRR